MEITDKQLRALISSAKGLISIYKICGGVVSAVYYAPSLPLITGMSVPDYEALAASDVSQIVMPSDRDRVRKIFRKAAAAGAPVDCTFRVDTKAGLTWVRMKAGLCGEKDGCPLYLASFENASNETDVYQLLLNHSNSMVYISDAHTYEMLYANKPARDYHGEADNSYVGRKCYEYIRGESAPCSWCFLQKIKTHEMYQEERYIKSRDIYQHIAGEFVTWCGREAFVQYVDDISESRKLQKELENSQRMYKLAVDGAHLGVWEYDVARRTITMPEAASVMSGFPQVIENVPQSLLSYIEPQDRPKLLKLYEKVNSGVPSVTEDLWVRLAPELPPRCERQIYTVVSDKEGRPVKAYVISQNVTAQKRENEKFRNELQSLLTLAPNSLCMFRLNLTRNICSEGHGASKYIQKLVSADTVDGLFDNLSGVVSETQDKQSFRSFFSRGALLAKFARGDERSSLTYRRQSDSGEPHWVTTYINMLQNPDTSDVEAIAYSLDVDRAKKEEEILASVTGNDFDFIALINAKTRKITYKNITENARNSIDHLPSDYSGAACQAAAMLSETEDPAGFLSATSLEQVAEKLDQAGEYSLAVSFRGDGGASRKKITFRWLNDSRREVLFTRTDITDAFRQEQQQADQIRKALLTAERANSLKSEFLSNVSHDLRTPMNAVLGYAGLALKARSAAAKDEYLDKIIKAGQIMTSLINDTLDLSKIETGAVILKPEPIRNADVMQKIMTTVTPWLKDKKISFTTGGDYDGDTVIITDPLHLYEIFVNLISNAVKFTPAGGHIEFASNIVKLAKSHVWYRISVSDDGVGMSSEFQTKLFEPFTQERTSATAGIGGSGLGLSIVKRLVELMGGSIKVRSELGKGTEFVLYLDFDCAGEAAAATAATAAVDVKLAGRKLLLCEDNAMNTEIAETLLEAKGAQVVCAANGKEGLEKFAASAPGEFDAVLMDLRMPVMNGFEAAAAIRGSERSDAASIPIIAMSADAYDEDVAKSREAGMNSHVAKPVAPEKLFAEIARLCAARENQAS